MTEYKQHKEKYEGVWAKTGEKVTFSREWGRHRFTDEECRKLLAGEEISFSSISAKGRPFDIYGVLSQSNSDRNNSAIFQKLGFGKKGNDGKPIPPKEWCGHTFTAEELQALKNGETVDANDFVSRRGNRKYATTVRFGQVESGQYKIIPKFSHEF